MNTNKPTENEALRTGYAAARLETPHGQAPAGATEEVENLRKALVYVAFALHDTPQYMLAQGITLIDGDTVRVSRDGWTVEASVNPLHQPAHQSPTAQPVPAAVAWPVAVLKFERGTPGRENEMPRVVSCNWMPDGEYEVYLAAAPTTQPAAAPGVQWQCGPQANGFMTPQADSGAAPLPAYPPLPDLDGTLWLAIGQHRRAITHLETTLAAKAVDTAVYGLLRAYVDADRALRASRWQAPAGAAPTTQPAPQQEAQEPVMIYHGDCTIDCGEHGHPHVELLRMIPAGSKLYTAPQPSPAAQGDAELGRTAMRFVDRAGDVHPGIDDAETICAEFYKAMSDVIEKMPHVQRMQPSMSAPASQEGKSHDN